MWGGGRSGASGPSGPHPTFTDTARSRPALHKSASFSPEWYSMFMVLQNQWAFYIEYTLFPVLHIHCFCFVSSET